MIVDVLELESVMMLKVDLTALSKQQIKLLNEANSQVELPAQLQSMTVPKTIDNLHDIGDLQKHKGNEEELVALLGDYLPLSYKKRGLLTLMRILTLKLRCLL